jgi:two-component system C4-dicarboxylate transport sensor histidine kinase DctB
VTRPFAVQVDRDTNLAERDAPLLQLPSVQVASWASRGKSALRYAVALAICLALGVAVYRSVFSASVASQHASGARRLEFFALSLESVLKRNEALPGLISLDERLKSALDSDLSVPRQEANAYLETVAKTAKVSAAYLMNDKGLTIAASNWNQPVTFVGENYSFRPYFQEAIRGEFGRFYGIGATSGEAGYFLACEIKSIGGARGVVVVKIALDGFEDAMRQSGEQVFVSDPEGVILLSSVPGWRYQVLEPLAAESRERLRVARQYGSNPLIPVEDVRVAGLSRTDLMSMQAEERSRPAFVAQGVGKLGWTMVMLLDRNGPRYDAAAAGTAVGFATAFVIGVFMHLSLSRRRSRDRVSAQRALQEANEHLENHISARTAALTQANETLARKVSELKRAEDILRQTRDSAVQAGKLAALGQMSAGMSHELSQPLAALHTLSDNAIHLLQNGRIEETKDNIALISQLAGRLGRIVRQLKALARKQPSELTSVNVLQAVEHALMIVDPRRRAVDGDIWIEPIAPDLAVRADPVGLEQVLVNLINNGLDAIAGRDKRTLQLRACLKGSLVTLRIRDWGPGISANVLPRLFEAFYTTKRPGEGLGLGLALSKMMVEGFGGHLAAANVDGGGAMFTISLEAA